MYQNPGPRVRFRMTAAADPPDGALRGHCYDAGVLRFRFCCNKIAFAAAAIAGIGCSSGGGSGGPPEERPTIAASEAAPESPSFQASGGPSAAEASRPASSAPGSGSNGRAPRPAPERPIGLTEEVDALLASPPAPPAHVAAHAAWLGPVDTKQDGTWIARLARAPIVEATPNKGGASISIRLRFEDGHRAVWKPEQTGRPTNPMAEIAAFHVDRLLGFGRTAVVVGRRMRAHELRAALVASGADEAYLKRFDEVVTVRDREGRSPAIRGAAIAWHNGPLIDEEVAPAWLTEALEMPADPGDAGARAPLPLIAEPLRSRVLERSDLMVFDFLIDNADRDSGGNILHLRSKTGPLIFLDQGAAFGDGRLARRVSLAPKLATFCRFRKQTIAALRAFTTSEQNLGAWLESSLSRDPLAPVLGPAHIAAIGARSKEVLSQVEACRGRAADGVLIAADPAAAPAPSAEPTGAPGR